MSKPTDLALVATEVAKLLKKKKQKLVLAESCTGGMIATSLVANAGISENLAGSFVVYQVESKKAWLGLKPSRVKRYSVESVQIAADMAVGALKRTKQATLAASVTGFLTDADPKNDGRVCFAVAVRRHGKIEVAETLEVHLDMVDLGAGESAIMNLGAARKRGAAKSGKSSQKTAMSEALSLRLKRQMLASWVSLSMVRGLLRGKPTPH